MYVLSIKIKIIQFISAPTLSKYRRSAPDHPPKKIVLMLDQKYLNN